MTLDLPVLYTTHGKVASLVASGLEHWRLQRFNSCITDSLRVQQALLRPKSKSTSIPLILGRGYTGLQHPHVTKPWLSLTLWSEPSKRRIHDTMKMCGDTLFGKLAGFLRLRRLRSQCHGVDRDLFYEAMQDINGLPNLGSFEFVGTTFRRYTTDFASVVQAVSQPSTVVVSQVCLKTVQQLENKRLKNVYIFAAHYLIFLRSQSSCPALAMNFVARRARCFCGSITSMSTCSALTTNKDLSYKRKKNL